MRVERPASVTRCRQRLIVLAIVALILTPGIARSQGLHGVLIGVVNDQQGGVLAGARITLSSPALIGGPMTLLTDDRGQLRFVALPPGLYSIRIELQGFLPYADGDLRIGPGATTETSPVLQMAGQAESIVVLGGRSHLEARNPGFGTLFGEELQQIPARRAGMFDAIRFAPGISPTSPSSGMVTTVSAFGSGTNENHFLFDGTNFTCPCSGIARAEPGTDFIQEVHVQSVGASAEYGNMQGAVINVITRQGSERFLFDAAYYAQTDRLTSHPVELAYIGSGGGESAYRRRRLRDATMSLGGPAIRDRLWFFAGYQSLRDLDSQPGTDPAFPRQYEQEKVFGKLTWKLGAALRLEQSFHGEFGLNPDRPTIVTPFEAITRREVSVPATTFGHLTHAASANTLWDVRVGRFVYSQDDSTPDGSTTTPSRLDRASGVTSGAPPRIGSIRVMRTTAKGTLSRYLSGLPGADHQLKIGGQLERGEHDSQAIIPTGVRYVDNNGRPSQSVSADPSNIGGASVTVSAFASDALTIGDRLTVNAGLRFDHSRAQTQDLHALDSLGQETDVVVPGGGTLYTWNILSPRLGVTMKLTADGRTLMRASYGRFSQGVLTGEIEPFHPGAMPTTTRAFVDPPGEYSRVLSIIDPKVTLAFDPQTRAPRTDEYSIGVDREVGRRLAVAIAYVHKDGDHFIGWSETAGQYSESELTVGAVTVPVFRLTSVPLDRRYLLKNQPGYSLTYNGLVMVAEKRRADGWQAHGSYTLSKAYGLQASSGATAAGPQVSTVSPPNAIIFGRDPNDLTNARGRLPNDRPHMFRLMGSVDLARTGLVLAANMQHFTGKPWAQSTLVPGLPQGDVRILLEPRGSRRLSSQSLLDLRVSRTFSFRDTARLQFILDVLNVLDDSAEEGLATDNVASPNFARGVAFVDPRRAMFSVRIDVGR